MSVKVILRELESDAVSRLLQRNQTPTKAPSIKRNKERYEED